jgi:multidrug efflux pump subunit AcrB
VEDLREMRIRTAQDEEFPLKEIADVEMQRGLIAINHLDGQREVRVEADLASLDVSAPEVTEQIQQTILPDIMSRYPNVNVSFEGQMRESRRIFSSLRRAGIPILIIMASMLVITFRSFSQALALLLVIPFGVVGAVWGHAIHGLPVSLLSMLGFIALVGILVNDGLVFVNAFNNELRKGRKFRESLVNTGNSRFRPLVLTTITTSVGLAPLILEQSLQAQFLIPMAVTVAYGLLLGSFFIATLLPVFLTATNGAKVYAAWLWTGRKPERESVERAVREVKNEEKYE